MYLRTIFSIVIIVSISAGILSCRKKDEPTINRKAILSSSFWSVSAKTRYNVETPWKIEDLYSDSASCHKDDFYVFHRNGTLLYNLGYELCSYKNLQYLQYMNPIAQWDLNTYKNAIMVLYPDNTFDKLNIATLTSYKLVYTYTVEQGGVNYLYTETLMRREKTDYIDDYFYYWTW